LISAFQSEVDQVLDFARGYSGASGSNVPKILDVGSGKGRYLRLFRELGWSVTGVEANERMVGHAVDQGFEVFSPVSQELAGREFDIILMSHVIEHFSPNELVGILRRYLLLLKPGGAIIISTPLLTSYFFDDFDHVKPYQPLGLSMLLCDSESQLQFQWPGKFDLVNLWYRKSPFRMIHFRSRHLNPPGSLGVRLANKTLSIIFYLSLGLVGQKSGWVGVFKKIQ
jgi:SAM-dependent methyltransferase